MLSKVQVLVFGFSAIIVLFLSIISFHFGNSQNMTNSARQGNGNENVQNVNDTEGDLLQKLYWNDSRGSCGTIFNCNFNLTDGWDDKKSYELSTLNNTNQTWSWIYGKEVGVKLNDIYNLTTHMKLNNWATQSHIALEGFNGTSGWYQITQCPSGINGPLEWKEYKCLITIPENATKIRVVLNAGWSAQQGATAVTLFDSIQLLRLLE
jgi:hypothetical protein